MTTSTDTTASIMQADRSVDNDELRPALRAVFHRGPDGLTMQWVVARERRDGEVQIIVGDSLPASANLIDLVERSLAYSVAD